jgi:hypothetical protein
MFNRSAHRRTHQRRGRWFPQKLTSRWRTPLLARRRWTVFVVFKLNRVHRTDFYFCQFLSALWQGTWLWTMFNRFRSKNLCECFRDCLRLWPVLNWWPSTFWCWFVTCNSFKWFSSSKEWRSTFRLTCWSCCAFLWINVSRSICISECIWHSWFCSPFCQFVILMMIFGNTSKPVLLIPLMNLFEHTGFVVWFSRSFLSITVRHSPFSMFVNANDLNEYITVHVLDWSNAPK